MVPTVQLRGSAGNIIYMEHEANVDLEVPCSVMRWLRVMGSLGLDNSGFTDCMTWRIFCIEEVPQKHIHNKHNQARKRNEPHEYKAGKKNK